MKSVLFFATLLAPCIAVAQPVVTAAETTALDPVIVTASRTAEAQSQSLAATIVIDRAQIEAAQANDVADLLRRAGHRPHRRPRSNHVAVYPRRQ